MEVTNLCISISSVFAKVSLKKIFTKLHCGNSESAKADIEAL